MYLSKMTTAQAKEAFAKDPILVLLIVDVILLALHTHPVIDHDQHKRHRRVYEPSKQEKRNPARCRDVRLTVEKRERNNDQRQHDQENDQPGPFEVFLK